MDKQQANQLARLIAAELISDASLVEEIIEHEEWIETDSDAEILVKALADLRDEILDRASTETQETERDEHSADSDLAARYQAYKQRRAEPGYVIEDNDFSKIDSK